MADHKVQMVFNLKYDPLNPTGAPDQQAYSQRWRTAKGYDDYLKAYGQNGTGQMSAGHAGAATTPINWKEFADRWGNLSTNLAIVTQHMGSFGAALSKLSFALNAYAQFRAGGGGPGLGGLLQGGKDALGGVGRVLGSTAGIAGLGLAAGYGIISGTDHAVRAMDNSAKSIFTHDAQGYALPTTRAWNEFKASWGKGKVDSYGNFRPWEHYQNVIETKNVERLRYMENMQPYHDLRATEIGTNFNQQGTLSAQVGRFRALDAANPWGNGGSQFWKRMAGGGFWRMGEGLSGEQAYQEQMHPGMGAHMMSPRYAALDQQAYRYGQQVDVVRGQQRGVEEEMAEANRQVQFYRQDYAKAATERRSGGQQQAGFLTEEQARSAERLQAALEKVKSLEERRAGINMNLRELMQSQRQTALEMANAQTQQARADRAGIMQEYLGQSEQFGLMDRGEQDTIMERVQRFKKGGINALTADELGSLMNTPVGEDIRLQARERAVQNGFGDIYKDSRQEARFNAADARAKESEKLEAKIQNEITLNARLDAKEVANRLTDKMMPLIKEIDALAKSITEIRNQINDNKMQVQAKKGEPNK